MDIKATWSKIKELIDSNESACSYADKDGNYYLFYYINNVTYIAILEKDSEDGEEFEESYMNESTALI